MGRPLANTMGVVICRYESALTTRVLFNCTVHDTRLNRAGFSEDWFS
jgi:hypothetical protein